MRAWVLAFVALTSCASTAPAASTDGGADSSWAVGGCNPILGDCPTDRYCMLIGCSLEAGGSCQPKPARCEPSARFVCGANGAAYTSACEAQQHGVDVARFAHCPSPAPGQFQCGSVFCTAEEYCYESSADSPVSGRGCSTKYECLKLPASCVGKHDCSCASRCACTYDGGLRIFESCTFDKP